MIKIIESKKLYEIEIQSVSPDKIPNCIQNNLDNIKIPNLISEPLNLDFNLVTLFEKDTITQFELCGDHYNTISIHPQNLDSPVINHRYKAIPWSKKSRWNFKNIKIADVDNKSQVIYVRARLSSGKSFNLVKIVLSYLGCLEEDVLEKRLSSGQSYFHACSSEKNIFFEVKTLSLQEKLSQLMNSSMLENLIQTIYHQIIKKGDICIDGGAHVGHHTFPMSRLSGSHGVVHAFEVIPNLLASLSQKIESNQNFNNIILYPKALSQESGKFLDFFHVVDKPGFSGLKKNDYKIENEEKINQIVVETTTIDKVMNGNQVKFIKLDLEGAEFFALKGAINTLRNSEAMIIFENGRQKTADVYGYSANDFFQLFDDVNYRLFDLFGRNFTRDMWLHKNDKGRIPWYSIAVPKSSYLEDFVVKRLPEIIAVYLENQLQQS